MGEEMSQRFSESGISELLAKQRRQEILRALQESATPLTTIEVAKHIRECQCEPPSAEDLRTIHLALYHNHLPRLEDDDVVWYDQSEGTVHPGPNFDEALQDRYENACRVELFVRTPTPAVVGQRLDSLLDRLSQLRDDGFITDYSVRQWPPQGNARGTSRASGSSFTTRREIIAEFDAWAEQYGYTLQPAFQRRVDAMPEFGGGTSERYTVPLLTLAFYDGETLSGVIPCADDQCMYTVADFLSVRDPNDKDWIDRSDCGKECSGSW